MTDDIEMLPMGWDEKIRHLDRFPKIAADEFYRAMQKSLTLLVRLAKKEAPVGVTGNLRSAIGSKVDVGMGTELRGIMGNSVRYAETIEKGGRPKFPPISNIAYWVDRKMRYRDPYRIYGIALAIAHKIARRGVPKHPFFKPAWDNGRSKVGEFFQAAVARVVQRLEGK